MEISWNKKFYVKSYLLLHAKWCWNLVTPNYRDIFLAHVKSPVHPSNSLQATVLQIAICWSMTLQMVFLALEHFFFSMTVIDKKKNSGEFISTIKCFNLEVTHGHNSSTKISCTVIPSAKMCVCAQCCPAFCDPMDPRLLCPWKFPGKNIGAVAISYSKGSSWPRIEPTSLLSPTLARGFLTTVPLWKAHCKDNEN